MTSSFYFKVMDITSKEEDEVATALFDAGWDQNRAIEMLLEGGGGGTWEETGKKKKKKQNNEENKVGEESHHLVYFG